MKHPGQFIIWPSDIDSSVARSQGRKVPVSRSIKQPSAKEIMEAALVLGYAPQLEEKTALPKNAWHKTGYVIVKKTGSRQIVLRNISSEIGKARQREVQASYQQREQPKKK